MVNLFNDDIDRTVIEIETGLSAQDVALRWRAWRTSHFLIAIFYSHLCLSLYRVFVQWTFLRWKSKL